MEFLRSFLRLHLARNPVVVELNVSDVICIKIRELLKDTLGRLKKEHYYCKNKEVLP